MTTPSSWCIRPADQRFHSQSAWLDSWHSFSFAGHHHPDWMGFGPLRVINDDVIAAGQGFGMHPHRDMEIITVMVEGQLNHRDSMGNSGVIRAGDVQRMTAGSGIVHSEINAGSSPCRLLQIWIEPNAPNLTPEYEQRSIAVASGWTPLIAAQSSQGGQDNGAMRIARPIQLWRAQPANGDRISLPAT
ncbi:MAG: pirin family protein, partial [Synechococcus sp.]